jgi:alkylation response protein AidB-like acyl-CoA dehydrogenase
MELEDTPDQALLRAEVRSWLAEHGADAPSRSASSMLDEDSYVRHRQRWQGQLAEVGLANVTWPEEHGGRGLGAIEQFIVEEELQHADLPGVLDLIGINILGPCLTVHGTDAQKSRHLAPLLRGEEVWCQLFSEPDAGSDLAAIRTRAESTPQGGWRVSGQKVWTTYAQYASFGLLLARTDPDVPKHRGLTMFIVPMTAPGVTVRPLRQIHGGAEFNEVFLDGVELGSDAVVGEVNGGWTVALTTLLFERAALGHKGEVWAESARMAAAVVAESDARFDDDVRRRLGEVSCEQLALRFTGYRLLNLVARGAAPGPEAALSKITTVNSALASAELVAEVSGPDALANGTDWWYLISFMPCMRSAGGTEEILRNSVGERVLGLPPEPRVDKQLPFAQLAQR